MITTLISDFSRVILYAKDPLYTGELNALHDEIIKTTPRYNLNDYFVFNEELLAFYASLQPQITLVMFTSGKLQRHPQVVERLHGLFAAVISASEIRLKKSDPKAYEDVVKMVGVSASQAVFVDDDISNCEAAQTAGLSVVQFVDNASVISSLSETLNRS